jgi:hypothetical protein
MESILREMVEAYLKLLSKHLLGETEENNEESVSIAGIQSFKSGTLGILNVSANHYTETVYRKR